MPVRTADKRIVLIAGRPSHPPGMHEFRAGCLLFQKALAGFPGVAVQVYDGGWPSKDVDGARVDDSAGIVRERLAQLNLRFDEIYTEFFGVNACHGVAAAPNPDPPEVQLRIGVRGPDKSSVDRFTRELIPLVLSGPPTATGYGEGRPAVREVIAYWPALLPRSMLPDAPIDGALVRRFEIRNPIAPANEKMTNARAGP